MSAALGVVGVSLMVILMITAILMWVRRKQALRDETTTTADAVATAAAEAVAAAETADLEHVRRG